jgi:hypothetical protein
MIPTRVAQGGRPWAVLACIYCTGLYRQHTYRLLAVSLPVAPFAGEYSIGYGYSRLSPPLSPQPPPVLLLLLLPPRAEGQRKTLLACTGSSRSTTAALCQLHYASFHTAGMGWQLLLHPPPPASLTTGPQWPPARMLLLAVPKGTHAVSSKACCAPVPHSSHPKAVGQAVVGVETLIIKG